MEHTESYEWSRYESDIFSPSKLKGLADWG